MIAFRDEDHKEEVLEKLYKAKKCVCEALDSIEDADQESEEGYSERRGMYRERRRGMHGRMREDSRDRGLSSRDAYDY